MASDDFVQFYSGRFAIRRNAEHFFIETTRAQRLTILARLAEYVAKETECSSNSTKPEPSGS